ncbi:MAG: zf-TFIIB domain-containing protein [Deltaproteobacteria bacterium]|nr:zf-TFIIB domain-containing protein [Deltaproteobacteria bacterium]
MAKCTSCSAPLPASDPVCAYCGTRNSVDLEAVHEYTVTWPESSRLCPRCGVALQTVDLRLEGTFLIERCPACFGLFFDPGELEALLDGSIRNAFTIDYGRLEALSESRASEVVRYGKCPVCGTFMNRVGFGSRSGVVVDQCKRHGVWLDAGELRRLLEWRKAGGQLLHEKLKTERREEELRKEEAAERARLTSGGGWEAGEGEGWDSARAGLPGLLLRLAESLLR